MIWVWFISVVLSIHTNYRSDRNTCDVVERSLFFTVFSEETAGAFLSSSIHHKGANDYQIKKCSVVYQRLCDTFIKMKWNSNHFSSPCVYKDEPHIWAATAAGASGRSAAQLVSRAAPLTSSWGELIKVMSSGGELWCCEPAVHLSEWFTLLSA